VAYEWKLEVKYSPDQPRIPAGQSGGGRWTSGVVHEGVPDRLLNSWDGGAGPSILWHGTSNRASTWDCADEVYLTVKADEAEGYARDLHRMGLPPKGGAVKRAIYGIDRKPGPARSIDAEVESAMFEGDDVDDVIAREARRAREDGFRYLYFSHPSFAGADVQDVFISLYPEEDLKQVYGREVGG